MPSRKHDLEAVIALVRAGAGVTEAARSVGVPATSAFQALARRGIVAARRSKRLQAKPTWLGRAARLYASGRSAIARTRRPDARQAERRRRAERLGKTYRTSDQLAVERAARLLPSWQFSDWTETPKWLWVARLREELPEVAAAGSQREDALYFRARYYLDADFRAKEIARTHDRKARTALFDDGTLDGRTVQRLFAEAADCPYCGVLMSPREKTLDHVWPKHLGGDHSVHNAVVCCSACNTLKGRMAPDEWLLRLPSSRRAAVRALWKRVCGGPPAQRTLGLAA